MRKIGHDRRQFLTGTLGLVGTLGLTALVWQSAALAQSAPRPIREQLYFRLAG